MQFPHVKEDVSYFELYLIVLAENKKISIPFIFYSVHECRNVDVKKRDLLTFFENFCPHDLREAITGGAGIVIGIKRGKNKEKGDLFIYDL